MTKTPKKAFNKLNSKKPIFTRSKTYLSLIFMTLHKWRMYSLNIITDYICIIHQFIINKTLNIYSDIISKITLNMFALSKTTLSHISIETKIQPLSCVIFHILVGIWTRPLRLGTLTVEKERSLEDERSQWSLWIKWGIYLKTSFLQWQRVLEIKDGALLGVHGHRRLGGSWKWSLHTKGRWR